MDATPRAQPTIGVRAPILPPGSGPWFNTAPLTGWRGRATLVEFWTYSCVNCLRTLPALRAWHEGYAGSGLTILGVHTPEFPFERDPSNVARALRELGIAYPVVLDNDRAIWDRFANRAWPQRFLIDSQGRIVHEHQGEGGEASTERAIRALLAAQPGPTLPPPVFGGGDEATGDDAPGAVCVPGTPELFAGYYRGRCGNAGSFREDSVAAYVDPGRYREGYIHLAGHWRVTADAAHFAGPGPGHLRVAFRGSAPNAVLGPAAAPIIVHVAIAPATRQPAASSPPGDEPLLVDAPRLYRLPQGPPATRGLHLLTLTPAGPGLAVYSFTFGACDQPG